MRARRAPGNVLLQYDITPSVSWDAPVPQLLLDLVHRTSVANRQQMPACRAPDRSVPGTEHVLPGCNSWTPDSTCNSWTHRIPERSRTDTATALHHSAAAQIPPCSSSRKCVWRQMGRDTEQFSRDAPLQQGHLPCHPAAIKPSVAGSYHPSSPVIIDYGAPQVPGSQICRTNLPLFRLDSRQDISLSCSQLSILKIVL
jgi:hypothetical protein